ncbi:acetamidase/formamidase family protein [candidate division KSB1 bacterium]
MKNIGTVKHFKSVSDFTEFFPKWENFSRRNFLKSGITKILSCLTAGLYCSKKNQPLKNKKSDGKHHYLSREKTHNRWNKDIPPILQINSNDIITIETKDASDGHFTLKSTSKDVANRDLSKVHPLTGPIYVKEAEPGDVLQVDILKYELSEWGWTLISEGRGFLPEDFSKNYLQIWRYDRNKKYAEFKEGIRAKLDPFCGVMGVAWEESGDFRTSPPRKNGGNMDIKHLTAGTTLYLPVLVKGALFSAGDGHAAQGDGEVCVTAIETDLTVTLHLSVRKDFSIDEPQYENDIFYATTGFGTTIIEAAKKATKFMIKHLTKNYGLSPEEAYVLCSIAMDLKICEVVDLPNYLVSAHIPKSIFV